MMTRRSVQLIVLTSLVAAQAAPVGAASILLETTSLALSVMDEVVIAGLVVGALVLIDRASWSVLTGQKATGIKPLDDHSAEGAEAAQHQGP